MQPMNDPNVTAPLFNRPRADQPAPTEHWFTRMWSWIGAVDLSDMSNTERARASIVPMLILVAPAMALASGFVFALDNLHAPAPVAVIGAIGWAGIIFTIDRALVVSTSRSIGMFIVRVVLAAVIGFVVAEPLVARLFDSDIDAQVEVVREAKKRAGLADVAANPRYGDAALAAARTRLDDARNATVSSGANPTDVNADPEVTRLRAAISAAEQARAQQQAKVECESDGSCGTGKAGDGPEWQRKLAELNRLEAEVAALREQLAAAENAASVRSSEQRGQRSGTARVELPQLETELAGLNQERAVADQTIQATSGSIDSLGVRTEAFSNLREVNTSVNTRYWLITALLVLVDVVAVIVKTFTPPSPRDQLNEIDEQSARERQQLINDHRRQELETVLADDSARAATIRAAMQVDFDARLRTLLEDRGDETGPHGPAAEPIVNLADEDFNHHIEQRRWWDR